MRACVRFFKIFFFLSVSCWLAFFVKGVEVVGGRCCGLNIFLV